MRALVIGGSSYLGRLVLPFLSRRHTLRVFDLRPPSDISLEYVPGDVCDPAALAGAVWDVEAVLYMAMGSTPLRDGGEKARIEPRTTAFDMNVKGLHLAFTPRRTRGLRAEADESGQGQAPVRLGAACPSHGDMN